MPPGAHGVGAVAVGRRVVARAARLLGRLRAHLARLAAVLARRVERDPHRLVDRVVGGLEAEHEQRLARRPGVGERRLGGVEQAAVGRVEARLRDLAHRGGAGREVVERDAARRLPARALLEPHPGLGDHAEDALGADQHPVGARPGAGAGQAAALPLARRA